MRSDGFDGDQSFGSGVEPNDPAAAKGELRVRRMRSERRPRVSGDIAWNEIRREQQRAAGFDPVLQAVEDGLIDEFALEHNNGFVVVSQRPVGDQQFIQNVVGGTGSQARGGLDRRLEVAAQLIQRGGAIDRDRSFRWFAGEQRGMGLQIRRMGVKLVGEKLRRAAGGIGEKALEETRVVECLGWFSAEGDAIETVGRVGPFVAKDIPAAVGRLKDDAERACHLRVARGSKFPK